MMRQEPSLNKELLNLKRESQSINNKLSLNSKQLKKAKASRKVFVTTEMSSKTLKQKLKP
jgi:hypothetical protein